MQFPENDTEWEQAIIVLREIIDRSRETLHYINGRINQKDLECLIWAVDKLTELAEAIKPGDVINYAHAVALIEYMIDVSR